MMARGAGPGSGAPPATGMLSPDSPPMVAAPSNGQTDQTWLTRGCEVALDLVVVVLATWTVVYHVCLLLRLAVPWAVGLEVVALAAYGFPSRRARRRTADPHARLETPWPERTMPGGGEPTQPAHTPSSARDRTLAATTAASALAAAILLAVNASWPAIATLWLVAAVAGTAWAVLRFRAAAPTVEPAEEVAPIPDAPRPADPTRHRSALVALAWAVALAALSMFTLWPNPDDLYYVNLSQWVVDHGTFPLRDTIFSDLAFPMSSWPPMASYDALVGTLARLGGFHAASVAYIVVPPVATFLSVLALWRLLTQWRVKAVGVALSLALLFLLFDGGRGYAAPGNLFLIRIWQGKVILLCLMVPLLLLHAVRYVDRPTRGHAAWLFAGGVAAVGLSTTAMFLVPLLAVAGAAPLVLRRPVQALQGFVAMAAYPLAAGVLTVAVGGRSADLFGSRELFRFDPSWFGHEIFRDGPLAVIAVAAVLAGALLIPHRAARVTTGLLMVITGVTFVPGATHLSYDLVGLGPTLWRVSWVASIAALVGILGAQTTTYRSSRPLQLTGPVALLVALVLFGQPIWTERNGVLLAAPPHWQRGPDSVASAQRAIAAARPGDVVLAPDDLAVTIDVLTTRVKTVAPRAYFMDYLRDDPRFHFAERLTLVNFANRDVRRGYESRVARALTLLDVDEVCLPVNSVNRIRFVRSLGYRPVTSSAWDRCLTR